MSALATDLRHAVRGLVRSPGFTAIAVLTLALGIGANAAIFSVVRSVLLRPLPFPEPDGLVQLWESRLDRGFAQASFTHANFWDVRDLNRTFEAVGALTWGSFNASGGEQPERLSAGVVTSGFFRALGVAPVAGRLFAEGEDEAGAAGARIVVLGHALWQSRFGGDASVVGRPITLNGETWTVIGVLPRGTPWLDEADLFVPLVRSPDQGRISFELAVIGRLASGVTLEAARADLDGVSRRIAEQFPEAEGMGVTILPGSRWIASESLRRSLYVLTVAVGLLLLVACVNLANLLLARATGRVRENAVRAALGAGRGRIVRHALSESVLLGVLGAAGGLLLASAIVRLFRAFDAGRIPRLGEATLDGWVVAATLLAAVLTSVAAGLVPALRAPTRQLVAALREGERSVAGNRRAGRLRAGLVSIEVALSLMLLVGAGLLVRSFGQLLGTERGFRTDQQVLFDVSMPPIRSEEDFARAALLQEQYLARVRAIPRVTAAAAVSMPPLRGIGTGMGFAAGDRPVPDGAVPWASWRRVSDGYFETMGVPLLAGRDFDDRDGRGSPLRVIISRSIAERLWPGENAVGREFIAWQGQGENSAEVIGVVGDMRDWGLADGPSLAVYLPFHERTWDVVTFVARTQMAPAALTPLLRAALDELDPSLPLGEARSFESLVGESLSARRFTMVLLAALAGLALLLALAGVYGVLAYTVSRRRPEIGMRMALGASARDVLGLVVTQGLRPVAVGVIAGLAGAAALSRLMSSLLFGVTAGDPATYAGVAVLLLGASLVACLVPARGATRVDVLTTLREE